MDKVSQGSYTVQKAKIKYDWIFNLFKMLKLRYGWGLILLKMLK